MLASFGVKGAAAFAGIATAAIGAVGAILSVGIAVKKVTAAFTDLDKLAKTAGKLGVDPETLQKFSFAAEQTGVSADTAATALQRLVRRTAEAQKNAKGPTAKAFKDLGINLDKFAKLNAEDRMRALADAFQNTADAGEKTRLAMALFDTEGVGLVNTLQNGSAALDELFKQKEELGIIKADELAKIEAANDAFNRLGHRMKFIFSKIAVLIAPALEMATDKLNAWVGFGLQKLNEWLPAINAWAAYIWEKMQWVWEKVVGIVSWAVEQFMFWLPVLKQWGQTLMAYWGMLWDMAKTVFFGILDNVLMPFINWLTGTFSVSWEDVRDNIITALAIIEYSLQNWRKVLDIAFTAGQLAIVTFGNDVMHWFTNVLPQVFISFGSATAEFFSNFATNVGNAMGEVWDYIMSAGEDSIDVTWNPLTEGFQRAMDEIKDSADREMTDLERQLSDSLNDKKGKFAKGLVDHVANRLAEVEGGGVGGPKPPPKPKPLKLPNAKVDVSGEAKIELPKASFGSLTSVWEKAMTDMKDKEDKDLPKKQLQAVQEGNRIAQEQLKEQKKDKPAVLAP